MEKIEFVNDEIVKNISSDVYTGKTGITFNYKGDERILNNNYHTLVISEDDLQKQEKIMPPLFKQIRKAGQSFIINDKSGILYKKFSEDFKKTGYEVICLNLDNPVNSDSFNILELSYNLYKDGNIDKALEILENAGYYILYEKQEKSVDPFWINSATNFFVGCTLYMFENEKDISLNKILELTDKLRKEDIKEGSIIYTYLSGILLAPNDTKGKVYYLYLNKSLINMYLKQN